MSAPLAVELAEERAEGRVERILVLHGDSERVVANFRHRGDLLPPPLERADAAAIAPLFRAMREGRDLHVRGPVSRSLLDGIETFVEAWTAWRPRRYRTIEVTADHELEDVPPGPEAPCVVAFSGGLDSSTVLLRQAKHLAGRRTRPVAAAVLVIGFDIPPGRPDLAARAEAAARSATASIGVPLAIVETDWRAGLSGAWEDDFFTGLASVLHGFRGVAGNAVVACDADWPSFGNSTPWGSHFSTNHLLGGTGFPFVTDGGGLTQVQSAAVLRDAPPPYRAALRVCWKEPESGVNCGTCQKCVRRRLQLRVGGFDEREVFQGPPPRLGLRNAFLLAPTNEGWAAGAAALLREAKEAGGHKRLVHFLRLAQAIALPRMMLRAGLRFAHGPMWRRGS